MPDVFDAFNKSVNLYYTTGSGPQSLNRKQCGKFTMMSLVLPAVCLFGFRAGHISIT